MASSHGAETFGVMQLDPGFEVRATVPRVKRSGPNSLTLALTGNVLEPREIQTQAPSLFPGWDNIDVVSLAD